MIMQKSILFALIFLMLILAPRLALTATPPTNADALLVAAYQHMRAGQYHAAISELQQAQQLAPDHLLRDYLLFWLAASLNQTGAPEAARQNLTTLQRTFPASLLRAEAAFLEADTYFQQGAYDAAIQRYRALKGQKQYAKHAQMPAMYLQLGRCYEQQQQFAEALATYHDARFTFLATPAYTAATQAETRILQQHPELWNFYTTDLILKRTDQLLAAGRARDAGLLLQRLLTAARNEPLREKITLKQADVSYALRENFRARAYYRQFLRDYPASAATPYVLDRLARLYLRQKRFAGFLRMHDRLQQQFPNSPQAVTTLRLKGKELLLAGQFDAARVEFETFLRRHPGSSLATDVLWNLGWCQYQLGQASAALKTFEQFLKRYPKSPQQQEVLYWAGRTAERVGQPTKAAAHYQRGLERGVNLYFGRLCQQARAHLRAAHPELKLPDAPIAIKPLDLHAPPTFRTAAGLAHRQKAQALAQSGLYDLAARELAAAIERDAKSPAQYFELARWYARGGEYHAAARLMQRHFWHWIVSGDAQLPSEFWQTAFPFSFAPLITQVAGVNQIDPRFVLSIMLAESAFDPAAYSAAGAMGLMQLMPETGARLAARLGMLPLREGQYFQPEINVLLGATYLSQLLAEFHTHFPPAIASYNAGEQQARTWWNAEYANDWPQFVAMIPYAETKNYVQKVLWYYQEYQRIYPLK